MSGTRFDLRSLIISLRFRLTCLTIGLTIPLVLGLVALLDYAAVSGMHGGREPSPADIQQFRQYELFGVLVSGLVAWSLIWLVTSRMTRPLTNLLAVVGEVAKGHLDRRADEKYASGEIGQLARAFNHMVAQIEAKVERKMQALNLRNAELHRMHQIAQRQSETKEEFLANMSHEIRTPLTAILGYSELLIDINMSESERAKALQSIQYDSQHLLGVINDVLDIAKLDANKMETECSEFPVAALINDVLSLMRGNAQEKGIELTVEFLNELPELVWTDPARLRQILMNLVGNAVKYSEQGTVRLVVRLIESRDSSDGFLQFEVIDTGMGMTEEHIAQIFQPFSQGSAAITREYGGTGLGLVISQRFAKLLGGDIAVSSEFGEGSTFTLTLPIGPIHGRRKMNPNMMLHDSIAAIPFMEDMLATELEGLQVLLADDTATNRDLISRMLGSAGAKVTVVENGKRAVHQAIEAFQGQGGQAYNVILMDVQMPELDGISATKKLRQLGYPAPIIILTASISAANRDKCLKVGANDFARKPIERDKLIALVAKWGRPQKGSEIQRAAPAA